MTRIFVGTTAEGHKVYVNIDLGPDLRNDLTRFDLTTGERASADTLVLSMTYEEIDPRRKGDNAFVAGGAGVSRLPEIVNGKPALDPATIRRMAEIAGRWHLNGMVAYCSHQQVEGWGERRIDPTKPSDSYGKHFEGQQTDSWNLLGWVRPEEHPGGLLGRPCETCGYRYGTAWRVEPLPADVIAEIRSWGVSDKRVTA